MSFRPLEYNELQDVSVDDIVLDIFGEHSPNMSNRTMLRVKQRHYDALVSAEDIETFMTVYEDLRIGYSKSKSFYFYYEASSSAS